MTISYKTYIQMQKNVSHLLIVLTENDPKIKNGEL